MARPLTNSARYFPLDVDYLSDRRIRRLRRENSLCGVMTYLALLCSIYSDNSGFFTTCDDNLVFDISESLGISEKTCREVISAIVKIGLFDKKIYEKHGVLTSKAVQRRFQEIIKSRGQKRAVRINEQYWLLEAHETAEYIKGFSEKNEGFSEKNTAKENKDKENESETKAKEKLEGASSAALISEYEKYIGRASPNVKDGILKYLEKGFEAELIRRLIHYSCEQGKPSWQYLEASLIGNEKDGILTLSGYLETQKKRKKREKASRRGINNYVDTNSLNYSEIIEESMENMLKEYEETEGSKNDREGD